MEHAVKYVESLQNFVDTLKQSFASVGLQTGRRFDRVSVNGAVKYFVDRNSWEIFGAKSAIQFNPRRHFGKLDTVSDFDWVTGLPLDNTQSSADWKAREAELTKDHKPRGRPRKNPVTTGTDA